MSGGNTYYKEDNMKNWNHNTIPIFCKKGL
jgi:hypothetical protein